MRKWQPTLGFLLGKPHWLRTLVGYSSWGHRVRHDLVTEQIIQQRPSTLQESASHLTSIPPPHLAAEKEQEKQLALNDTPCPALNFAYIYFICIKTPWNHCCSYSHLTDEEVEAQKGKSGRAKIWTQVVWLQTLGDAIRRWYCICKHLYLVQNKEPPVAH